MYKYWLIYTERGTFKGFKAIGFNNIESLEKFKEMFKETLVFIETLEKDSNSDQDIYKKEYDEFVEFLTKEGDDDIPTFEQYKKEMEEELSRNTL